ncbi:cytochrome P450 [Leucogyrophana mollusca]|uniref:Cytochrome P450 n=1 Tax=Leucogyrophana mollusca TaxID=85980 RepID=A0ACB8BWM4_9AGAM|nr:cytochrome P450 [Leucogyrophana mollusca]
MQRLTTPGVLLLGRCFLVFSCFILLFTSVFRFASKFGIIIPKWLFFILLGCSIPFIFFIRIKLGEISARRAAASMGARLVPCVQGKRVGNIDVMLKLFEYFKTGYPGDGVDDFISTLGNTFNTRMLFEDDIMTVEPKHIKIILATDFDNYIKGDTFKATMFSVLGSGIFNSDGGMWKFHRSMTRPFFNHDRISHFNIFDRHADEAITQMKLRLRGGFAVDVQDLFFRFTLDSATEFLFGYCVDTISAGLPYPHDVIPPEAPTGKAKTAEDFAYAFAQVQYALSSRLTKGQMWPLFELFGDKTEKHMKVVNAFIQPIMEEAIEKRRLASQSLEEPLKGASDDDTLIDHLVRLTTDPVVLQDEVLNILTAARDTTASTLTFAIYFLATHPHILTRLREEILTKVGRTNRPTYDDIREMKYLRAFINETLRLFPVLPFNVRESVNATTWPSPNPDEKPFYIPAKTNVTYSVFLMHRRKDLWGPDAEEFDPDRFLDERLQKYLTPNPFIFLPFNAGPRICLGQQFAYNEISFLLIRILQNFSSMTLAPEAQAPDTRPPKSWASAKGRKAIEEVCPRVYLLMYAHGGLWVKMTEAENDVDAAQL